MPPSKQTLAKLNKLHYKMSDGSDKDKQKAIKKADKLGYEVVSHKRGVAHFKSKDEADKHHAVTIKGTNPSFKRDLMSDIHLAIGKSSSDKQFKKRTNEIKKIYSGIDNNEDKVLSGHSLGASIAAHAMVKSKSIRDNTKSAHLFNTGMTPAFNAELQKDLKKEDKKELKSKVTQYHVKNDPISAALTIGTQVGKVKTTKQTAASSHSLDNHHQDKSLKDDEPKPEQE